MDLVLPARVIDRQQHPQHHMARETYVVRDGELVPKHLARPLYSGKSPHVLSDIAEFVTQDGTPITSRSHLRAYERRHGIRQIGNDWAGSDKAPAWFSERKQARR